MMFLAAIGGFLRRVPLWVYVAGGLLLAGALYGHWRFNAGQADVQGKWDKALAEADKRARAVEDEWRKQVYNLAYEAEARRIQREKDTSSTIADIHSGALQLRERFKCPALPRSSAPSGQPEPEGEYGLRPEDAEFLVRFADERDQISDERNQCIDSYNAVRSLR